MISTLKFSILFFILILVLCTCIPDKVTIIEENYTQYVDPFIGTSGTGHTFPGATCPFGFVQLTPITGNDSWSYCGGYQYADSTVIGFAHTMVSGGGIPVLGDLQILPHSGKRNFQGEAIPFSKQQERATPGYYSTYLKDDQIRVDLTTTPRTGIHRYTFEDPGKGQIYLNIDEVMSPGHINKARVHEAYFDLENDKTINGYMRSYGKRIFRSFYFSIKFNKPFQQVELRVGISTVSIDGAKKNLEGENLGKSFENIQVETAASWNRYLSKIQIEGAPDQKTQFYTSMYHLMIQPNNIADVDGWYRGADDSVYVAPDAKEMYSTFAFWDIYRAGSPVYTLIVPDKMEPFINSILRHYDETGLLPIWPLWGKDTYVMIGNHAVSFIAEACLKGLYDDVGRAYEAIKTTLTNDGFSYNWTWYDQFGYLPSDSVPAEAISRTLEATYDDWCAAQLAKALNRPEDEAFFMNRSNYYKNVFDPETKFMRGRLSDGTWVSPFDPMKVTHAWTGGDYTEANAWHYTWHVQHDVEGLIELFGGKNELENKLDGLLSQDEVVYGDGATGDITGLIGQYAHGNEPCQHVLYLYNYADKPYKTQERIHEVIRTMYNTSPEGYCGNNDFGQMSAWYILSTLGFYTVNPASGIFDIGMPFHAFASIQLPGDKTFKIKANNLSPENIYVRSVSLNGKPVDNYQITYKDIMAGGELVFEMTNKGD